MNLFITQKSYYFVIRHFIELFEFESSQIVYVKEKKRGLFRKYLEILNKLGLFNFMFSVLIEIVCMIRLFSREKKLNYIHTTDNKLNLLLNDLLIKNNYKNIISIGCPCKIDIDLQIRYSTKILNLHGGIIPFQKGRFSPISSINKNHKYLGSTLYNISDQFDEGNIISQNYFYRKNNYILFNYNKVLVYSSILLKKYMNKNIDILPNHVIESLKVDS